MEKVKELAVGIGMFFLGIAAFVYAVFKFNSKSEISSNSLLKDRSLKKDSEDSQNKAEDHLVKAKILESDIEKIPEDEEWHKKR